MSILITLVWIWLTCVAIAWALLCLFWVCLKISDFQNYLNIKLNKAFGLQ
jgi:hypothetical protein